MVGGAAMSKQIKKKTNNRKKSKWERTCEICGNEVFSRRSLYKCPYCEWKNGVKET